MRLKGVNAENGASLEGSTAVSPHKGGLHVGAVEVPHGAVINPSWGQVREMTTPLSGIPELETESLTHGLVF